MRKIEITFLAFLSLGAFVLGLTHVSPGRGPSLEEPAPRARRLVAPVSVAPRRRDPLAEEVGELARTLDLDPATEARVLDLTRQSFYEAVARVRALGDASEEARDAAVRENGRALRARIADVLDPARAARYRALVDAR
jgi:hypothetical protein